MIAGLYNAPDQITFDQKRNDLIDFLKRRNAYLATLI
jgi:hypothetical protein